MKKFPILQVVLIILLIGAIILGYSMTKKKTNTGGTSKTGTETSDSENLATWNKSLYEAEQQQLQKKMENSDAYNSAVDTLDIAACEKIIDNDTLKTECRDNVYSAQASREKSAALCEKITDITIKARCASGFAYDSAIASGKQSDCEKIIGDSELKNACIKNIVFAKIEGQSFSGTITTCNTLTGADKDYCIGRIQKDTDIDLLQKGTNTKNLTVCSQIKDIPMKNTCSDTVYMTLAMEKQDGLLCAKIIDAGRKTSCTTQFARVNDANILNKAITAGNLSLCATITTTDLKIKCTDTILLKQGVANKDTTLCVKISDSGTRKQCSDAVKLILEQINK